MTAGRYSYFTDPAQQFFLREEAKQRESELRQYTQLANNPQFFNNLALSGTLYPGASAELNLAVARGGIPASDPMVQGMVMDEMANRDTLGPTEEGSGWWNTLAKTYDAAIDDPLKGAARWGFGLMDAAYQFTGGGALLRSKQVADQQGISFLDAWKQQDPYIFEALGGVLRGQTVSLGSGWMPNSDVAPDVQAQVNLGMEELERSTADLDPNERLVARAEGSPQVWANAVEGSLTQAAIGKPLTQMNYAETDSVIFDVDAFNGQQVRTPWSPGRIFAANLFEPGTEPFKKLSGTTDFASQIFLDPTDWVGGAWAKAGVAGRKVWATGKAASKTDEAARAGRQLALPQGAPTPKTLALPQGDPTPLTRALTGDEFGPPVINRVERRVVGVDDEGMNIIEEVAVPSQGAQLPGRPAYTVGETGQKYLPGDQNLPWWLSPVESAKRAISAIDPPDWFIDIQRQSRQGAEKGGVVKRSVAGVYKVSLPRMPGSKGQSLTIARRGKGKNQYWDVMRPDGTKVRLDVTDPRFDQSTSKFKTLKEAKEAAAREVARHGDEDLRVHGMTTDEFIDSGEDFIVDEYQSIVRSSNPKGPDRESVLHRTHKRTDADAKAGRNANVRVFGRSIDLSAGKLTDDIPQGLKDALDADRKVDVDNLIGFGDPYLEDWSNTLAWMEANGYGKLQWDEDTVLILDKFIGGNSGDQMGRMWFTDQNKPIHSMSQGDELLTGPTPSQINGVVDEIDELANQRAVEAINEQVPTTGTNAMTARLDELSEEMEGVRKAYGEESVGEGYFGSPAAEAHTTARRGIEEELSNLTSEYISASRKAGKAIDSRRINAPGKWDEVTDDDIITVYHATDPDTAARIRNEGLPAADKKVVPERAQKYEAGETGEGLYVSSDPNVGGMYGGVDREIVEIQIRKGDLETPREMNQQGVWTDKPESKRVHIALTTDRFGALIKGDIPPQVSKVDGTYAQKGEPRVSARTSEPAERLRQADIEIDVDATIDGVRPDFDPSFQLHGKKADAFVDRLAGAVAASAGGKKGNLLDDLLRFLSKQNTPVPAKVKQAMLDAGDDKEAIRSIFAKWLVQEGGQEVLLPGGVQYGRLAAGLTPTSRPVGVASKMPTGFKRRMAMSISGKEVNMLEDPDAAYALFDNAMPHYNINRGGTVSKYLEDGTVSGEVYDVEDLFYRLRNLKANDKKEAYDIMGEFSGMMFSSLVGDGVDPRLAERSAKWWRTAGEEAIYEAERLGRVDLSKGPHDNTIINDIQVNGMGPQLSADLWGGNLQPIPPRDMKRIGNETDLIGKIANRVAAKQTLEDGVLEIHERAMTRALDFTIQTVWKPLVLLRGAWTLRILMDDQMRMAAEGYSALNHPARILNYAMSRPQDWRDAFKKGNVDVFGVKMTADNVDEMQHAEMFIDALMKKHNDGTGIGSYGSQMFVPVGKGNTAQYLNGLVFEIKHLRGSPLTAKLANSKADDPVDEVVRWLQGEGPKKDYAASQAELANQAGLAEGMGDMPERILAGEREALEMVVNRQYGILHHRTGGDVVMDNGNGILLNYASLQPIAEPATATTKKARWIVREKGDEDILNVVRGKTKIGDVKVGGLRNEEQIKALKGILAPKVKASDYFPAQVRGPRTMAQTGKKGSIGQDLDKAVSGMFDWLMTKPSNTFSRVPEFQRAYWKSVSDMYPYMSKELKAEINKVARGARAKELLNKAGKRGDGLEGQLTSLSQVDRQAKAYGLTAVEKTLFNLTRDKRNISDSLRIVFPFVEAWGEFISRWSRLMVYGDRNIKNINRLRQTVGGARRSGFFQENDFGQEVFNYPAMMTKGQIALHNTLNNIPGAKSVLGGDVSPEVADAIQATGNVESLNFASSIIPGFGPVFQTAAKGLPDNPDYDWIRDIVAPFGTEGRIGTDVMPAWFKRVVTAQGGGDDPQLQYAHNSAVIDVIRTKVDNGEFAGVTNVEEVNAIVRAAEEEAKGLTMVRAAATYWNPASPTYKFQKEDKDGLIWSYSNLGGAFYDLLKENGGDEGAAYDAFYQRFGSLPTPFTGSKTYETLDRAQNVESDKFERRVPELFQKYPSTAMYLDPMAGTESEYSHSATVRQLKEGVKHSYTGEQYVYIQQDQLGDIWWDNINKQAALIEHPPSRQAFLAQAREQVESAYPFWNKPVPGKIPGVSNEEQMAEVDRMLEDPSLTGAPILDAVRTYQRERLIVLERIKRAGASTIDGPKSMTTDSGQIATHGRSYLREISQNLFLDYPEFEPMFRSVYNWEIDASNDAPAPTEEMVAMFGAEDGFVNMGVANG